MDCDVGWLRTLVRPVADFPKPGVTFADITPVLADADAIRCVVELLADEFVGRDIDLVAGIDARGFILGSAVACRLGAGFIPLRKPGRLPCETTAVSYELEYGRATLEMHVDAAHESDRVLIVDDVLATGGTAAAAAQLIRSTGATIEALAFLLAIEGLDGAAALGEHATFVALGSV